MPSASEIAQLSAAAPGNPLAGRIPLTYKGARVLTTELAAGAFGVDEKVLRKNFERNDDRFEDGKHYHVVRGDALRALKHHTSFRGVVDPRAAHLYLWTERGIARHAKILESDPAWEIFEALEDTYFRVKAAERAEARPKLYGPAEIRRQWTFAEHIAASAGLTGNPLLIAANRAVRATTNFDVLGSMGLGRLTAEVQDTKIIVSKLAIELEMSARAVNVALEQIGLQVGDRDHKNNRIWKLTDAGRALGGQLTQVTRSNDTGQAEQIVWPIDATLSALRAHLEPG